jgi:hypothetical protein
MALIDATPRSATARAMTDGKLLLINREDFYEILRKEAPLAVKLLWSFVQELSARLRQTNADLRLARSREPSDEIMDLSEEILVSDSSGGLARVEALREPSIDEELDPEEIEAVEFEDPEPDLGFEHEMGDDDEVTVPVLVAPPPAVAAPAAAPRKTMPYMAKPAQSDQLDITLGDGSGGSSEE